MRAPRAPQFQGDWYVSRSGYQVQDSFESDDLRWELAKVEGRDRYPMLVSEKGFGRDHFFHKTAPNPSTKWVIPVNHSFGDLEQYNPLRYKALHREFSETCPTEDGVITFANQYGLLGDGTCDLLPVGWEDLEEDQVGTYGEPLFNWILQIRLMEMLVKLWDLYRVQSTSDDELAQHVGIENDFATFRLDPVLERVALYNSLYYADFSAPLGFLNIKQESKIRWATRVLLESAIGKRLAALSEPRITLISGSQITLAPNNLLGVLYFEFAQETIGRADPLIRCAACGKWFVSHHASKKFCNDKCKMKAYRKDKKGAAVNGS